MKGSRRIREMSGWIKCNYKRSMSTAQQTEDKREKIQALSLAKECYSMKLDLLTNATVVEDAIRFVSSNKSKDNKTIQHSERQEEETKEITFTATTNQLF
jgi:hypothetical protein